MKKNSLKKFSMKMRMFYFSLISILFCIGCNLLTLKSENVFMAGIWGIVTLCGIATTGKAADDFQRGMFFQSELITRGKNE